MRPAAAAMTVHLPIGPCSRDCGPIICPRFILATLIRVIRLFELALLTFNRIIIPTVTVADDWAFVLLATLGAQIRCHSLNFQVSSLTGLAGHKTTTSSSKISTTVLFASHPLPRPLLRVFTAIRALRLIVRTLRSHSFPQLLLISLQTLRALGILLKRSRLPTALRTFRILSKRIRHVTRLANRTPTPTAPTVLRQPLLQLPNPLFLIPDLPSFPHLFVTLERYTPRDLTDTQMRRVVPCLRRSGDHRLL